MKPLLFAALICSGLFAADWLSEGGDPFRDNWQQREKGLTPENVKGIKMLWKRELAEASLTAPVILGPIITHRGIKELVFAEGASGTIYAIDADLGRTFWTRKLESTKACPGMPVTPLITPERVRTKEDGEGHTPIRPIYFAGADGAVHKIMPTTGEDVGPTVDGCGETSMTVAPFVPPGTTEFSWQGREVTLKGILATWADAAGVRWVYSATGRGLQASVYNGEGRQEKWVVPGLGTPVIANGMLFALSTGGTVQLNVLDAKTGNMLYSSSESLAKADRVSSLALANGHICFTTSANVLYCFGIPIEI
jgi:outer membrane protein assembly factor BamB